MADETSLLMIKTIVIAVAVLVAALLIFAATRPDTLRVERAISVKAPPEKLFALINDFNQWPSWSPYEKRDPAMKKTLSGAATGKGSVYEWEGNSSIGKGRMEIVDSAPPSKVTIKLDFIRPFEGHNVAEFTLTPQADGTHVTWAMDGPRPYIGKLIGIFLNMDAMIGNDFDAGLANMKAIAEKPA